MSYEAVVQPDAERLRDRVRHTRVLGMGADLEPLDGSQVDSSSDGERHLSESLALSGGADTVGIGAVLHDAAKDTATPDAVSSHAVAIRCEVRDDPNVDTAQFAERLAQARAQTGTQESVARSLSMGTRLLQRWEAGEVRPRLDRLFEFCAYTGASADWLLGLTDDATLRLPGTSDRELIEGSGRAFAQRVDASLVQEPDTHAQPRKKRAAGQPKKASSR